jgi:CheY-like chemotaxis protein
MMNILLVDDDAFLRDMYATKFSELGHQVDAADSADAALKKIEETAFDVVLLDMIMPGMTGVELIATIKEKFPKKKIKCIVLSNQGQETDIEEAKLAGATGYIVKAEMIPSHVVKEVEKIMSE